MRLGPAGWALTAVAAASWGAVITIDTVNLSGHAEHDLLGVACIATALAGVWLMVARVLRAIEKAARANRALAEAVTTLQLDLDEVTGPHRVLRAVAPNGRGRHATPR